MRVECMRQCGQKMRVSREVELPANLARAYTALREEVDHPLWVAEGLAGTEPGRGRGAPARDPDTR